MEDKALKRLKRKLAGGTLLDAEFFSRDCWTSRIGEPVDGVTVSLSLYRSCQRRGVWRVYVSVNDGPGHPLWGCFDEQDQPMRWYHLKESALAELEAILGVLVRDRLEAGPLKLDG